MPYELDIGTDASDDDVYRAILREQRERIENDTAITDARRASLLARLDAAENADTPDRPTLYALAHMHSSASDRRTSVNRFVDEVATLTEADRDAVVNEFRELENSIDRSRSAENPETYTEQNINEARNLGIGTEAGTVHAFVTLRDRAQRSEREALESRPELIAERTTIENGQVSDSNYRVLDYGYDRVSGYIEFRVENTETGEIITEGYRGPVGLRSLEQGMAGEARRYYGGEERHYTPGDFWHEVFHNRPYSRFDNELDRLRSSRAPRCARCGQWANNAHTCPTPLNEGPEYIIGGRMINSGVRTSIQKVEYTFPNEDGEERTGTFEVDLPLVNDYRKQIKDHGSLLIRNVSAYIPYNDRVDRETGAGYYGNAVKGDIYLHRNEEGVLVAETRSLTCVCAKFRANGDCRHVQALAAAAIKRATPPQRTPASQLSEEERAQRAAEKLARIEAANATDWTTKEETMAEARRTWKENSEVTYSEDFDSFYEVLNKATEEKAAKGSLTLPYKKENALGGLATRESEQAFGVEIEYDFPDTMSYSEKDEANRKIGKALKEANLTPTDQKQGYHAAARNGYNDRHVDADGKGTWSWEHDGTVAGEIVTPLMYDEPETWENLEKVTKILKDNGAIPTTKAGAHVHVGTARFGKDPKKYEELTRMVGQHEDVLYRLATDPARGEHRGKSTRFTFASPISKVGPDGFQDANGMRRRHWQRTAILNISGASIDDNYKSSHVEFRMFDATLDPAVMQNQIKLALNMTDAADRIAGQGGTKRDKESLGDHAERQKLRGRRKPKKEDIERETSTFRSLLDTLFQSKEDKDNAIRIFAANEWVKLTAAQRRRYGSAS
jgi:hypothetical protein